MAYKIYTKTGDKGTTGLIGGERVSKNHIRIESYGTIDELNSYLGVVSDGVDEVDIIHAIRTIQDRLFTIGSELATSAKKEVKMKLPDIYEEDVLWLEEQIDNMNEELPEMRSFILPGGNLSAAHLHHARTICRRVERALVSLGKEKEVRSELYVYFNRLSDYFFTAARWINWNDGVEEQKV